MLLHLKKSQLFDQLLSADHLLLAAESLSRLQGWPGMQQDSQKEQRQAAENRGSCNRAHRPGQAWNEHSTGRRSWRRGCPWGSRRASPCTAQRSQAPCTRPEQTLFGLYKYESLKLFNYVSFNPPSHFSSNLEPDLDNLQRVRKHHLQCCYLYCKI